MAKKIVYQTLEDRENPDFIEEHGPFTCNRSNAWLGNGYYFWDTFIGNAHWWGKEGANYTDGYIICKAECDFNINDCFDLVGETDYIQQFNETICLMKTKGIFTKTTTVARVINYLKEDLKLFKFNAIRVYGVKTKAMDSKYHDSILFNFAKPQYLDLSPAIQICFFHRNALNLSNYRIVFPSEYIDGYLI